jgi:hypothetical protein
MGFFNPATACTFTNPHTRTALDIGIELFKAEAESVRAQLVVLHRQRGVATRGGIIEFLDSTAHRVDELDTQLSFLINACKAFESVLARL